MKLFVLAIFFILFLLGCGNRKTNSEAEIIQDSAFAGKGSFAYDLAFLQKHRSVIMLGEASSPAKVLIVKDYQARVMTSTARGDEGNSYGWINYKLIESGKNLSHFNPIGGEDRFWIGPEGGQNSVFFKNGDPFDFEHWQTPALIDTDTFDLVSVGSRQATFSKTATLTNYQGFTFHFKILRQINLLNEASIEKIFDISIKNLSAVGYQSLNSITNSGDEQWTKQKGLLSIWILGMFTPSEKTTILIPHEPVESGKKITDDYFGAIPAERILKKNTSLLFKGDGKYRSKVGIPPSLAKGIAGSYSAEDHILTLIKYDLEKDADYVNSKWEIQKEPYGGDVVNAYNDGPLKEGGQLGPFYELESSSPAKALAPNKTLSHRHITLHLEGDEALLDVIAQKILGLSLNDIAEAFPREKH